MTPHPGVTHCYERQGTPNLWFTLTAPAAELEDELSKMAAALAPAELLNLPALRKFKIEAVFDVRKTAGGDAGDVRARKPVAPGTTAPAPLSEAERGVVRALQGNIGISPDPLADVAATTAYDSEALLTLLQQWRDAGILRRIGLIMRHRKLGFTANSMCVWKCGEDAVEAAGCGLLVGEGRTTT